MTKLFENSEATTDVQVSRQELRSFEEAKSLKAGDGLQGGEGDPGDTAAFSCAPQTKQRTPRPQSQGLETHWLRIGFFEASLP